MRRNILARIKYYVFKRMYDDDLYKIFKLSRSIAPHKLHRINIKRIRKAKIFTRFNNVEDYIASMDVIINAIKRRKTIEKNTHMVMDCKDIYLDDWLTTVSINDFSVYNTHKQIQKRIIDIVDEIYKYHDCDTEYFSYYKRCNALHFQQLKQWTITIKNIIED